MNILIIAPSYSLGFAFSNQMKPKTGGKKLGKVCVKTLKKVPIIATKEKYKSVCVLPLVGNDSLHLYSQQL